jgi:hypothetical protein
MTFTVKWLLLSLLITTQALIAATNRTTVLRWNVLVQAVYTTLIRPHARACSHSHVTVAWQLV